MRPLLKSVAAAVVAFAATSGAITADASSIVAASAAAATTVTADAAAIPSAAAVTVTASSSLAAPAVAQPESGAALLSYAENGIGPLSLGLGNRPLGAAFITGKERPDLFLSTGRHSSPPGFYLLHYSRDNADGSPVFGKVTALPFPVKKEVMPSGTVWQDGSGTVYGFWIDGKRILRTRFDKTQMRFVRFAPPLALPQLPRSPSQIAVRPLPSGALEVLLSIHDGTPRDTQDGISSRDKDYRPYDGALISRRGMGHEGLYRFLLDKPNSAAPADLQALPALQKEALYSFNGLCFIDAATETPSAANAFSKISATATTAPTVSATASESDAATAKSPLPSAVNAASGWIGGTRMGNFHFYPTALIRAAADAGHNAASASPAATPLTAPPIPYAAIAGVADIPLPQALPTSAAAPRLYAADENGTALRHPIISASPVAYPSPDGHTADVIAGGEGALYYYRLSQAPTTQSAPRYAPPVAIQRTGAPLFAGTLPVISVGDLNGDGVADILAGNSEGKVLLFINSGSDAEPRFLPGIEALADGEPIHIQQGYVGVQGPQEQRWGYACPRLFDWNGDGLPDIVMSSANATHDVYLNTGSAQNPQFGKPQRLYADGSALHGTWRVQPAVAQIGDRTLYVILDEQDELHAYWKLDGQNLQDGGKLRFADFGTPIIGNYLQAGGSGRLKLNLADWDGDGTLDLLVGTPRYGLLNDSRLGGPLLLQGFQGASVLFLKNLGTNEAPRYARPTLVRFRGKPLFFGGHACSPAATTIGTDNGGLPNLLLGTQDGTIYYYDRKDLSWD